MKNVAPNRFPPQKFISVKKEKNIITVDLEIIEICCMNFLCELKHEYGNDTLTLSYIPYGNSCSCSCKYKMHIVINENIGVKYLEIENQKKYKGKNIIYKISANSSSQD